MCWCLCLLVATTTIVWTAYAWINPGVLIHRKDTLGALLNAYPPLVTVWGGLIAVCLYIMATNGRKQV